MAQEFLLQAVILALTTLFGNLTQAGIVTWR